jgi:hypothetical protein
MQFALLTNGETSLDSGMQATNAGLASNYDVLAVMGVRSLDRGDYVSCFVYAEEDDHYTVKQDQGGFHVLLISTEMPSISGADVDVVSGGVAWQEVWGHPIGHDASDEGWGHVDSDVKWGTCGMSRGERIQCCADECVRLGPAVCSAFAIYAKTREDSPTECHYITAEDMPSTCMRDHDCMVATDNFGYGWGTWIPDIPHGWDAVTAITGEGEHECTLDRFFDRSDEVNAVCCQDGGDCTDGMPNSCGLKCAQVFIPFYDECRVVMLELMDNDISAFTTLSQTCLANSKDDIWKALQDLRSDGCEWGDLVVDELIGSAQAVNPSGAPLTSGGSGANGGHRLLLALQQEQEQGPRRLQGLNFRHRFEAKDCPTDGFTDRVKTVDEICCMEKGVDVCPPGGVPQKCTIECGLVFRPFFKDCSTMVQSILDDEYEAFEQLDTQCNSFDDRDLLTAMSTASCAFPAASCAEYHALEPMDTSGIYGLRTGMGSGAISFETHCSLAEDFGTTGHPFTRFWHYDGGEGAAWPEGSDDVLGDEYGSCQSEDFCFGRLPEWLSEKGAQLVVFDGSTTVSFDFNPDCDTAHAAWQAFHDHATGRVSNGCNWTPTLLQGEFHTILPDNTDCWAYDDSWGVKSFLLDDDGCYCASAIEAGKIMCGTENSWEESANGASLSPGVDFVAPEENCAFVRSPLLAIRTPETFWGPGTICKRIHISWPPK